MAEAGLNLVINVRFRMSFWQALKLRVSGLGSREKFLSDLRKVLVVLEVDRTSVSGSIKKKSVPLKKKD